MTLACGQAPPSSSSPTNEVQQIRSATSTAGFADDPFVQVSAGAGYSCRLRASGSLICWGDAQSGQTNVPGGRFKQISTEQMYMCGLRTDNTIACWGDARDGETTPPQGTFTYVSWDGTPPEGSFTLVDASSILPCALRADATITCRGVSFLGPVQPPSGTFTQLVPGCALRTGSTIACWGYSQDGMAAPLKGALDCWGNTDSETWAPDSPGS